MSTRKNILILVFDCLRPDHLASLGYHGTRTPTFDRFVREGTTFPTAYCQAPNTWISHASLFTGCNPYRHGLRAPTRRLSQDLRVMAEVFREAGYATFGLPAMSLLSNEAGFARGFDDYVLDGLRSEPGVLAHRYDRTAEETLARTKGWLQRVSPPFFGWIHYFGTHKVENHLFDLPEKYRRSHSPYAQYYDGKISFADQRFLSPLVDELSALGLLENTIVVLWSDHGEDLHAIEHGRNWGHNWSLTEEVMRTVLIMKGPGLGQGQRHEGVARSIDIFPTLADLVGLPPLPQFEGKSLLQDSFTPADQVYMENLCQGFAGIRRGTHKLVLAERNAIEEGSWRWKASLVRKTIGQLMPAGVKRLRSRLRRSDTSIWCRTEGEAEEVMQRLLAHGIARLYDLEADPHERHNLAATEPAVVEELRHCLSELVERTTPGSEMSMTEEDREQVEDRLRGLGYL
jgi:arylsulfatase